MKNKNFEQAQAEQGEHKNKAKFGYKPFAFFSGVFDIVIAVAILGVGVYAILQMLGAFDTGNEGVNFLLGIFYWPFIAAVAMLFGVGGILFIIAGILTLVSSFKSDRKNFNGLLVAAAVFDVLLMPTSIFLIYASSGNGKILNIVLTVLLAVGFVFKIIDIVLTKRRLKKFNTAKLEETSASFAGPNFDNLSEIHGTDNDKKIEPNLKNDDGTNGIDFSKLGK